MIDISWSKIDVNTRSAGCSYSLYVGNGLLAGVENLIDFSTYSKVVLIADKGAAKAQQTIMNGLPGMDSVFLLDSGEKEKSISSVESVWNFLHQHRVDRKSLVINFGGGVVCDLGGFAASTFMRGVPFLQIPTTLLSQVDASIGGKTGVNFGKIKNLVGAFSQPETVLIDLNTLQTLSEREYYSGYAEIVKHGLIADRGYFERLECFSGNLNDTELTGIVSDSCWIKKEIVERDERESGLRKNLNFGHTAGHVFETLSHESGSSVLLHGEAVSIGIIVASALSEFQGRITEGEFERIKNSLSRFQLPVTVPFEFDMKEVLKLMQSDKKNACGKVNWTLLNGIGKAVFDQSVSDEFVKKALERVR